MDKSLNGFGYYKMLNGMKRTQLDLEMGCLDAKLSLILEKINSFPDDGMAVHEMNETMYKVADLLNRENLLEGKISELGKSIEQKFNTMMSIRLPQFISDDFKLYEYDLANYFTDKLDEMRGYNSLGDKHLKEVMSWVCYIDHNVHLKIRKIIEDFGPNCNYLTISCKGIESFKFCEQMEKLGLKGFSLALFEDIEDADLTSVQGYYEKKQLKKEQQNTGRPR